MADAAALAKVPDVGPNGIALFGRIDCSVGAPVLRVPPVGAGALLLLFSIFLRLIRCLAFQERVLKNCLSAFGFWAPEFWTQFYIK